MQRRGIEVDTATASMQVVGKRHYGRKAREAGGGGGRQTARELFDTLLFWKARVKLDEQGRATRRGAAQRFAHLVPHRRGGQRRGRPVRHRPDARSARRRTDAVLRLPPLVREQDRFRAGFTVRNASDRPLEIEVRAKVDARGRRQARQRGRSEARRAQPGAGRVADVGWDVKAPVNADTLRWEVTAQREDGATARQSSDTHEGRAEGDPGRAGAHLPGHHPAARAAVRAAGRRFRAMRSRAAAACA